MAKAPHHERGGVKETTSKANGDREVGKAQSDTTVVADANSTGTGRGDGCTSGS
jgi:hypothetical protein